MTMTQVTYQPKCPLLQQLQKTVVKVMMTGTHQLQMYVKNIFQSGLFQKSSQNTHMHTLCAHARM